MPEGHKACSPELKDNQVNIGIKQLVQTENEATTILLSKSYLGFRETQFHYKEL